MEKFFILIGYWVCCMSGIFVLSYMTFELLTWIKKKVLQHKDDSDE